MPNQPRRVPQYRHYEKAFPRTSTIDTGRLLAVGDGCHERRCRGSRFANQRQFSRKRIVLRIRSMLRMVNWPSLSPVSRGQLALS